ncbi:MAG TPA: efflux RND transporter periplasmic adaptor subunit [Bryobacteraceae bacterium]|nr:efflux RND transporter periplasmic adaptor subunit [Bryobacteraceae bacterium]
MNKYIVRTSLVWLSVIVLAAGFLFYRSQPVKQEVPENKGLQPVAAGPPVSQPVQLTPEGMQSIGVKTSLVERKQIGDDIRATGTVDINERLLSYVQLRYHGYIRKVFANATYQYVRKGDPLFTIYSPDLVQTQQDYLDARNYQDRTAASSVEGVASGAEALAAGAEERLRQWDVAPEDLAKLKQTRTLISDLLIASPVSGYITERNALPNLYVEPSTRLYTVADLSRVWVNAQIFQDDVGRLKPGDMARINVDAYPGRQFSGRIESILPQVDMATRTVRARLEVANPGIVLKPGMYVNVDLKTNLGKQLVVAASAVLQSGTRQLVFLDRGNGTFEPKEVTLGPRLGDDFIVLAGLQAGQSIVTSANFLIDSESQLQAAATAGSYTPPPPGAGKTTATAPTIGFTTSPDPPHKGSNTLRVKLSAANNASIDGADVTVTFYMAAMPAMGMAAMNTTAKLTGKGNGVYEGTGTLGSGGSWQVTITAQRNGQPLANKQLRVNAEGGM